MPRISADLVEVFPFRRLATGVELLLLQRAEGELLGGTWHAVHGRVEPGETAVAAAWREVSEETGLRPIAGWQLPDLSTYYVAAQDTVYLQPAFAVETVPTADVRLSAEHLAFRWVPILEASSQMLWPCQRRSVAMLISEILAPGTSEPHLRIRPPNS